MRTLPKSSWRSFVSLSSKRIQGRPQRQALTIQARNILLFTKAEAARAGITLPLTDGRAQHIKSVLKSDSGDLIRIGVVNGLKGTALVKEVTSDSVRLLWNTWQQPQAPPPITLLLAMPRPKALRRLWSSLAEVGLSEVVVTNAHKVEPGYDNSRALRAEIVLAEVLRGLEQAGDTMLPSVMYSPSFQRALKHFSTGAASGSSSADVNGNGKSKPSTAPEPNASGLQPILASSIPRWRKAKTAASSAKASAGAGGNGATAATAEAAPPPKKLAFITQCLNVRRVSEEERVRGVMSSLPAFSMLPVQLRSTSAAAPSPLSTACSALVNHQFFSQLNECVDDLRFIPLKLVAHPNATTIISDAVAHYKKLMNQAGFSVWNLDEVPQIKVAAGVTGDENDFDRYYGSRAEHMVMPEPGSMDAMLQPGHWETESSMLEGSLDVGTTQVDTRWWGDGQVVVAVGPEGGWTEWELQEMQDAGFIPVGMGPRTLSSSNAVVSILATVQEAMRAR